MYNYVYAAHTSREVDIHVLLNIPWQWKHGEFGGNAGKQMMCWRRVRGGMQTAHTLSIGGARGDTTAISQVKMVPKYS